MRPADKTKQFIKNASINSNPEINEAVLKELLSELDKSKNKTCAAREPNIWRKIMKSPITKIAAAVVILGLFILTIHLRDNETPLNSEQTKTVRTRQNEKQEEVNRPEVLLEKELEMAKQLFERKDLPGLTKLLQSGMEPTKARVARYLGQIGDESVLSALQIFAEQWQGSEQDNPFRDAIGAIQERQAKSESPETTTSQEPNEPQNLPQVSETVLVGTVVDKNTAQPIPGAEVGFRPSEAAITDAEGRFRLVYNETYEEAYVYIIAQGYANRRIVVRMETGTTQNVTIELNQGSKFAGVVMDSNGQAVQGAEVDIFGLIHPALVTDAEGRFEIDGLNPVVHSYSVLVTHPMYPSVSMGFPPAAAGQIRYQEIILKPGVVVFGQVTDLQGEPVSGVTVGNTHSRSMWNCITTETDEEGMYQLEMVEAGDFILWAVHDSYAPYVERTILTAGQTERLMDIQLKSPYTLYGHVVDGDENPVPGATIVIGEYNGVSNLDRRRHSCDSDGRFTIPNAPADGELELRIFGDGITGRDYKVDFGQEECLIVVRRSGKIYGEVLDATTGESIPKFLVKMTATQVGPRTYGYSATWSREGYTFDSPKGFFDTGREDLPVNGQFRMIVSAEGYGPVTLDPVMVQPISEDPNRTKFMLQPATVFAGRVVGKDGRPIKGATVVFFSDGNVFDRENWPRAVTDKAGVFAISGLGSEPQCIFVNAADFTPRVYLMSDLLEKSSLLADMVLDRGASLFGHVVDEKGKPMAGVKLHAFVDLGRAREVLNRFPSLGPRANTDKNGYYKLSGVPTGQVQVSVMSTRNYPIGHKKIDLKPGVSVELNFGNEEGYVITGTVRAGRDILKNAQVSLHSKREGASDTYYNLRRTDSEGRFKLIHVPKGTYMIYVHWSPSDAPNSTKWPKDTKFEWHQLLEVQKDIDIDINAADSPVEKMAP